MTVAMEASVAPLPAPANEPRLRVVHLTTSYPRHEGDFAGRFVADLVRGLAGRVDVSVLGPAATAACPRERTSGGGPGELGGSPGEAYFAHFGLANGGGLVGNVRRRPWLAPLLVVSMI